MDNLNVDELEKIFNVYQDEACELLRSKGQEALLKSVYTDTLEIANILLSIQRKMILEFDEYYKTINQLKDSVKNGQYTSTFDIVILGDILKKKSSIYETVCSYKDLASKSMNACQRICAANDFLMLPYQSAVVKLITDGIHNQDNYNEEISRIATSYQNNKRFKIVYKDMSYSLIPFISSKLENMMIDDDGIGTNNQQKGKRFPN